MTYFILFLLGWVFGFGHARFSDYAFRTRMWPYNSPKYDPQPEKEPGYREPAKVPFMVTRDQQQALADLGYSKDDRAQMTPVQAHKVIEQQVGPKIIRKSATQFRTDCRKCNARFEYTMADVHLGFGGDKVMCPECKEACWHFGMNAR